MAGPTQSPPRVRPKHIAIIMDGNGRWAKRRGLPRSLGHRRGAEALRGAVAAAVEHGIQHLTVFAFSSENWRRPANEINDLMGLLRRYLNAEVDELHKQDIRLRVVGERSGLPTDLVQLLYDAEQKTSSNKTLVLSLALNYGGRQDILAAVRHLAESVQSGQIMPSEIDEPHFTKCLLTSDLSEPDLLIRTSGEKRLSNFLLWQLAYAEMVFLDVLWPDFTKQHFEDAVIEFQRRKSDTDLYAHG